MAETTAFSAAELTGHSRSHIIDIDEPRCSLHRDVLLPFLSLRSAALGEGIDLRPASSYRDFSRQLAIWNAKCRGERPLRDAAGRLLDASSLAPAELVDTILIWSALPGASRHHWGTDFDAYDAAAIPPGYEVQLSPGEFAPGGVFARLNDWLDANAEAHGFFRPYTAYRGGVQPEPWHLSHAEVAGAALSQYTVEMLRQALQDAGLEGHAEVSARLPEIVARYVRNIDAPARGGISPAGTRRA
jgi:LAS superfamily LD-carboxypeptidase LdcB